MSYLGATSKEKRLLFITSIFIDYSLCLVCSHFSFFQLLDEQKELVDKLTQEARVTWLAQHPDQEQRWLKVCMVVCVFVNVS